MNIIAVADARFIDANEQCFGGRFLRHIIKPIKVNEFMEALDVAVEFAAVFQFHYLKGVRHFSI